jgi:FlaA1/EpsC-like NDP-sugar epimerase
LKCIDTALYSPTEMMEINIEGTRTVIEACILQEVEQAFYLSTDKATHPSTFYGGTKFIAEQLWVSACDVRVTRFIATRFGNALFSTGSVLTRWEREIQEGKPLTIVGDGSQTRFLLTLQHGVAFILQALRGGMGGLLESPPMGTTTILELAHAYYPGWATRHIPSQVEGERDAECVPTQGGLVWSDEPSLRLNHLQLQDLLRKGKDVIW